MVIIVSRWKQKLKKLVAVLVLILLFSAMVPLVSGILYEKVPVFSGWFDDEHPSGNPMRVENNQEGTNFDQVMDQLVIKLQNFYYEEKE